MRRTTMRRTMRPRAIMLPALAIAATLLPGCGPPAPSAGSGVTADRAYVRLPAVPGHPAAGYVTLHGGAAADRLVAIDSPAAARIELHASMADGGMMTMRPLSGIDVPAGGDVALAPGGSHAMIFGLTSGLKGSPTELPLTLHFRSGTTARVDARTIAAGDDAP